MPVITNHTYTGSLQRGKAKKKRVDPEAPKVETFPEYSCPSCNKRTKLDFDPLHDRIRFEFFICPHCHGRRESHDYREEIEAIRLKHKKGKPD